MAKAVCFSYTSKHGFACAKREHGFRTPKLRGVPPTISQDRGEIAHGGAGGSAAFSPGTADFSPLPAMAQTCPSTSGGTDPGLYRAGHCVPAPDLALSRHYLHARAARSATHRC